MALPLRRQFIILNAAIVIPVFAIVGWSASRTHTEHLGHLAGEANSVAQTVLVYLERGLDMISVQRVIEAVPLPDGSVITITNGRSVVLARSLEPAR